MPYEEDQDNELEKEEEMEEEKAGRRRQALRQNYTSSFLLLYFASHILSFWSFTSA